MTRLGLISSFSWIRLLVFTTALASVAGGEQGREEPSAFRLRAAVIGAAGCAATSPSFVTNGTLCQSTPVGIGTAGDHILYAGFWKLTSMIASDIENPNVGIAEDRLYRNIPNPFHTSTTIQYAVAREGPVDIKIFDVKGRKVRTLVYESMPVGIHRVVWDATDEVGVRVSSGLYFYLLTVGPFRFVEKMLILK